MSRAFIVVIDSFGIGGAPDAERFGDTGADTLGHIAEACARGKADIDGLRSSNWSRASSGASTGLCSSARAAAWP